MIDRSWKSSIENDIENLESLERAVDLVTVNRLAIEKALQSHPVTKHVRDLPFEDYGAYAPISGTYTSIFGRKSRGSNRTSERIQENIPNVFWTLPAKDAEKLKSGKCGVTRSLINHDLVMTACSFDKKHIAKAKGGHCWSFKCPNCMNSAALKQGVHAENKIMAPGDLFTRSTGQEIRLHHFVLTPPQEWAKRVVQNSKSFVRFFDDVVKLCEFAGLFGGCIVFHPWREKTGYWEAGPHFHVIAYGRFMETNLFRSIMRDLGALTGTWGTMADYQNDDSENTWNVFKIHPAEEVRSVRQTIAYVLTHAGIGSYHYENRWDLDGEDLIIPSKIEGTSVEAKEESLLIHRCVDREDQIYREDYSNFDFLKWTKESMISQFPIIRYFGNAHRTRILEIYEETKIGECPICGSAMKIYNGFTDTCGEPSIYIHKSPIRTTRADFERVSEYWEKAEDFRNEGNTILDFAVSIPQCSTPETMGVQEYDPNETPSQRKERRDCVLVYLPSKHGKGLDPVLMTKAEYREYLRDKSKKSIKTIKKNTKNASVHDGHANINLNTAECKNISKKRKVSK